MRMSLSAPNGTMAGRAAPPNRSSRTPQRTAAAKTGPVVKMHTVGHDFVPAPIHAGGLRYHGMSPSLSALVNAGYVEARAVHQLATFEAAVQFAQAEGILPAPEPSHAIRVAIDEALKCKETGEQKVIAFNLCGHGHFDMCSG